MTDFSKLFTDPSAQVYEPDATESALWQQSTTNPFAVLHALAARRGAGQRRDAYGEQLAAHDARAQSGAGDLMKQENTYNTLQELIKQKMVDPGTASEFAGLRNEGNAGRWDDLSQLYTGAQTASSFKDMGTGLQALGAAGKQALGESNLSNLLGVGNLADVATTGEREQEARGRNDSRLPFTVNTTISRPDANGNMITAQDKYATKEERDAALNGLPQPAPVVPGAGKTNAGKKPKAGDARLNAPPPPSNNAPKASPQMTRDTAPRPVSTMEFKALPPAQQQAIAQLRDQGYKTSQGYVFKLVPNSLRQNGSGTITATISTTVNGQVHEEQIQIKPDGS